MNLFSTLLLLFTVIPLIELSILITIGAHIGIWNTIIIVLLTAITGAWLARNQGIAAIWKIREALSVGKMPAEELFDGVLILVAGIVLITPGILTDIFGIMLLVPPMRELIKKQCKNMIQGWINKGGRPFNMHVG